MTDWQREVRARLEADLPTYGVALDGAARARMGRYLDLVRLGNERVRLVGSCDAETLVRRHVGESLAGAAALGLGEGSGLADLGSGAGFPGLALSIGVGGLFTTLVESHGKKAEFLRAAVAELGLGERVRVVGERAGRRGWAEAFEAVACRALEGMAAVPGWAGRYVAAGGVAGFWVTRGQAAGWREAYPEWAWGEARLLPGARERAIIVARPG